MIKAVLVDDEILVLNLLGKIISETKDIEVIGTFTDPELALVEIPKLQPNVVFLDVDMPELNGIELGTRLIESNENEDMEIVFVTAYEQYAIHAFKLNAIHYILKPVDPHSINEIVSRVYQKKGREEKKSTERGEINLFGNVHLRVNGNNIDFLTGKIEELLALLILNRGKGISKWVITDILWKNSSIEKSLQNLYTMIFRLKKMLKNVGIKVNVTSKNSIYRIELTDAYCDVIEFDRFMKKRLRVNDHNLDEFKRVISLYQGDLFEEKDYLWCMNDRERYYQDFVNLVKVVANYYGENKRFDQLENLFHTVRHKVREEDFEQLIVKK
ncbi:response regulator [Niallia sp. JL1B1071]|uniref:response regulator n=1 Tax=Niallia tiangongensis TaxID=3237105 RepID=UPI0037DC5DE5